MAAAPAGRAADGREMTAVDNPPHDPGLVVKRRRACEAVIRCQTRYRVLAVRLKRIAAARGMTPEELLDGMERADG